MTFSGVAKLINIESRRLVFLRTSRQISRKIPSWLLHRNVQMLLDGTAAIAALWMAYLLRFDFSIPPAQHRGMARWLIIIAFVRPCVILITNGYKATWRFFALRDAVQLGARSALVTAGLLLFRAAVHNGAAVPYSVLLFELFLFMWLACGLRTFRRYGHEILNRVESGANALIIGSDTTLASAVRHLRCSGNINILGLVTENERLVGLRIDGILVRGHITSLPNLLATHPIELVIVAGADIHGADEILRVAAHFGVQVRLLPSWGDLVKGNVQVRRVVGIDQISHVRQRKSANTAHAAVVDCFADRVVLITGAGGSIGSELVRQVADLSVKKLIVLDRDENSIFELMNELKGKSRDQLTIPIVSDIRDHSAIRHAFAKFSPDIVLHAAAYKHVPVMEDNCCEAVLNNICGTRELADAAIDFGCEKLVMISTDKAVRPSSVMGASKRAAEMLIQQRAIRGIEHRQHGTQFACVRFGNVLGSRGSVVPIFLRQIANGGPVTITHEEMTRYFMTIPQAVQLVLQAATLASTGDVYMLEMGDPVKIIEFAKEIIEMSGLTPGRDIEIKVVGMRPGEKIHEQLWNEGAEVGPTTFPHVFRVKASHVPTDFSVLLQQLEKAGRDRKSNEVIQDLLRELPIDYQTGPYHDTMKLMTS
ncbi:polysaccharide biosynthesis protein [Alloacidobacterium dinghuense]|uniref:Polysaccharide biosynthesis protein n=1 Tax=Alloacidobacterium dinghuense TaxID=2763107 RepID=A0A7G8BDY6_9BACT|nr:nucleoside-diphosphate sugar epimerase/dehydratase [Alloacidobacterium dinghuense]QNI30756.1 polysaccharide biosynthesis protein [Alloacidobacterium dinghuense]